MNLTDTVLALASELRGSGVGVSVAETTDALRALTEVPLERREAVKAALAVTMVKEPAARRTFDRLFEVFFPLPKVGRKEGRDGGRSLEEEGDLAMRLSRALRESNVEALAEIAEELVDEAGVEPEAKVSDEHYRYRALRNLDLEDLVRRMIDQDVAGKGTSALARKLIEEDFEERMDKFSEQIAEEIRRRKRMGLGLDRKLMQERRRPPEEVDFLWAQDSDLDAMRAALYPLGRRLALRLSRKRRRAHRGRLDVRRTIRRSLSTGGVMLEPRFRRPAAGKPELWVLCDISGSMRNFARFTLELIYVLSTQFQRVRSFVFVDALDEVTHMLEVAGNLSTALTRIDKESHTVDFDGQSWYGNALMQFWARFQRELSPRTTLLVIGDARNNFRTSGAGVLREVRSKVRRVWWLNPEPREYWDSADSIASQFRPQTDGMWECRNLKQLELFVGKAI